MKEMTLKTDLTAVLISRVFFAGIFIVCVTWGAFPIGFICFGFFASRQIILTDIVLFFSSPRLQNRDTIGTAEFAQPYQCNFVGWLK